MADNKANENKERQTDAGAGKGKGKFDFILAEDHASELLPAVDAKRGLALRITTTGETEKQHLVTMTEGSTILRQYSFTSRQEAEDEAQHWAEQMRKGGE